jgi:hypothetical protein
MMHLNERQNATKIIKNLTDFSAETLISINEIEA